MNTVYLDNAATSFPKPRATVEAMVRAVEEAGGNPGRGAHALSLAAARELYRCREKLCDLLGCPRPENVVFTYNATHALNVAIKSLIPRGSAVAVSALEHNSVVRPLRATGCKISVFDPLQSPDRVVAGVAALLDRGARAVVCAHASNVLPVTLPAARIGALCRKKGAVFIVDAAQSAGILDIDFASLGAHALCLPGHKSLWGPGGCGAVIFSGEYSDSAAALATVTEGGSGVSSASPFMPAVLPERFEAGTPGVPAVAGLAAGIDELLRVGTCEVRRREEALARITRERLGNVRGVTLHDRAVAAAGLAPSGPIVLFNVDGLPGERVAEMLDGAGFCLRAGLHCSPYAHARIGTLEGGGAVRCSFGYFNTASDADRFAVTVREIARETREIYR